MGIEEKRKFIINVLFYALIAIIAVLAVRYVYPLVSPFLVGFFVAFILRRPIAFLSKKLKLRRGVVAIVLTALLYATVGTLVGLLGVRIILSLKDLFRELPGLYRTEVDPLLRGILAWLDDTVLSLDPSLYAAVSDSVTQVIDAIGNLVSSFSLRAVSIATEYLTSVPGTVVRVVLAIIASFFFAADYPRVVDATVRVLPKRATALLMDVKHYLSGTLFRILLSYFFIMCITYVEVCTGLAILGIERFWLFAIFIAVLDVLPVLGTGTVLIPWAVILLAQGQFGLAVGLLVLYAVVFVIRQVIEPRIVGQQVGLHPIVILVSLFAGVQIFGGLGIFLLPVLVALFWHLYKEGKLPWKQKNLSD